MPQPSWPSDVSHDTVEDDAPAAVALPDDPAPLRTGYDPDFLGIPVPLPPDQERGGARLDYVHFTVVMHRRRVLARLTAVVIDGASLVDLPRTDIAWRRDPRIDAAAQAGNELYRSNDLDRGHLVRRLDPVWGEPVVAAQANVDTFHYTNAAPQHARFNQSHELWLGLEDHLLDHAGAHRRRLCVWTGPVLAPDDPVYRQVRIPLAFWKIAGFVQDGRLAATAYLLDQTPMIDDLEATLRAAEAAGEPPPLGPFRTYQVPVADVVAMTSLDVGPLLAADVYGGRTMGASTRRQRWRLLGDHGDVVLRRGAAP